MRQHHLNLCTSIVNEIHTYNGLDHGKIPIRDFFQSMQYFSLLKIMILNNLPSSQYGRGLSIQSCFPEIKSVANSSFKSSGEDDASLGILSDDDLSLKDAFGPATFHHGHHESSFNFASDIQHSHLQPHHQAVKSPVDFLEAKGSDDHVVLDPSIWPFQDSSNQMPSISAEPNTRAAETGDVQRNYFTAFVPLHNAALKGDWEFARKFFILNPQAELVNIMKAEDLALPNKVGNTALCFAAISGIKKIAEVMVNKNRRLPSIRGSKGATPLCMAALLGHREMVWYLYSVTEEEYLKEEDRVELLVAVINADLYVPRFRAILDKKVDASSSSRIGEATVGASVVAR
ncbi:hypothetical protein Pint_12298 [Pistacia integerrima]|uniref:Uncharacterized protein n=1 Tax=Pistacia integerrima TaxID=434235 RepID=A0ACC0XJT6_9ROSI|nr:hypothetical protein Pint_12298 [Pistacia integerrima]